MNLKNHILPTFENVKLSKITGAMIEKWLFGLKDKGCASKSANHYLTVLRIMLNEAYRLGTIKTKPMKSVKPLKVESKKKDILTEKEFKKLFDPKKINIIWDKPEHFITNLLSACMGMRLGEVQALRAEHVFPDYVHVCHSWDRKYGLKDTKTHDNRDIPIHADLHKALAGLISKNPKGYVFSIDGGQNPIFHDHITDAFYKAMVKIKITEEKRQKRNITFHSWRHFFNSTMRGKIADYKLQRLTGHKTQEMTEHYTHVSREDLKEMITVQGSLLLGAPEAEQGAAYVN